MERVVMPGRMKLTQSRTLKGRIVDAGAMLTLAAAGVLVGAFVIAEAFLDDPRGPQPMHASPNGLHVPVADLPSPWFLGVPDYYLVLSGGFLVLASALWLVNMLHRWQKTATWISLAVACPGGCSVMWAALGGTTLYIRPYLVSGWLWIILGASCAMASMQARQRMNQQVDALEEASTR